MDLKHPTTKIPNHENETPPHSQSIKLLTYPNGKTHHHTPTHTTTPPQSSCATAYRECLKNHAVGIGGHALDGCGEFMPSPTYNPSEPSSFKCAACGCHRNFHRRAPTNDFPHPQYPHQTLTLTSTSLSPASPPPEPTNYAYGPHLLLSLGTAADLNHAVSTPGTTVGVKVSSRKRFRTKFSQEQKDKMLNFAERVGWKMQRCDDKFVTDFCNEIGIRRRILKVWMHNNKNTPAKREKDNNTTTTAPTTDVTATATATVAASLDSHHQENGSSSSS